MKKIKKINLIVFAIVFLVFGISKADAMKLPSKFSQMTNEQKVKVLKRMIFEIRVEIKKRIIILTKGEPKKSSFLRKKKKHG